MNPLSDIEVAVRLEVPEQCGCKVKAVPLCLLFLRPHGCESLRDSGQCDHPFFAAPCPHVLACDHGWSLDHWGAFLRETFGWREYGLRRAAPAHCFSSSESTQIEQMQLRYRAQLDLFHPLDPRVADWLRTHPRISNGANGATYEAGLVPDDDVIEDIGPYVPSWFQGGIPPCLAK